MYLTFHGICKRYSVFIVIPIHLSWFFQVKPTLRQVLEGTFILDTIFVLLIKKHTVRSNLFEYLCARSIYLQEVFIYINNFCVST